MKVPGKNFIFYECLKSQSIFFFSFKDQMLIKLIRMKPFFICLTIKVQNCFTLKSKYIKQYIVNYTTLTLSAAFRYQGCSQRSQFQGVQIYLGGVKTIILYIKFISSYKIYIKNFALGAMSPLTPLESILFDIKILE